MTRVASSTEANAGSHGRARSADDVSVRAATEITTSTQSNNRTLSQAGTKDRAVPSSRSAMGSSTESCWYEDTNHPRRTRGHPGRNRGCDAHGDRWDNSSWYSPGHDHGSQELSLCRRSDHSGTDYRSRSEWNTLGQSRRRVSTRVSKTTTTTSKPSSTSPPL